MDGSDAAASTCAFKDLAESIFMGLNLSRMLESPSPPEPVPVIHVKDVTEGLLTPREALEPMDVPRERIGRQRLQPGDILVSARGTLLKCAVVRPDHQGCVASANFIVIRPAKAPPLHPDLLCAFLRQPQTQTLLLNRVSSTAQPALTIRDLESLSVTVPAADIQETLVQLIRTADEQYRTAVDLARLRREEALAILADHMENDDARG